ncbi:MAG TPA: 50S ribosomal protein L22 [Candidatus Megaira endosymbiont of Hartmannula sinica]|nr:50S ribosomal protein L22 [Candidatus Megaera endosymbiont of Hartmannula sinica]
MSNFVRSSIKKIRISSSKLSSVARLINNMSVTDAIVQLSFSRKRVANDVKKCLNSAVANAENNMNFDIDSLFISRVTVGKSIVMKRFRARARGRSASIKKQFSNLYITLSNKS